ncbi:MAG TPA: heme lyase CcmF/NrfE family subunit [Patescibacteria group bacterium]|nr:heme lyase CcmF/NrfE family subunit [Patescibacteria group bacterium]
MIVELAHFALALALVLSLMLATVPMAGAAKGRVAWMALARPMAISLCGLVTIALLGLVHAYALSDFSVLNVQQNSHTLKPWIYKITGVWGNHEGSILLWAWMLTSWMFFLAARDLALPAGLRARVLSLMGLVVAGFLSYILVASNPFLRLSPAPREGLDLNPVLQDPLLAIHPPVLYAGYVGFSVAFCFALAALIEKKVDPEWAEQLRPWVMAAWVFMTLGIMLGATWAYYELGWGGFWFWDPVENASLMPWLAGTALLHSVAALQKRGALKIWTVLLCILTFTLSLLGTFLVRSGILTSVHSFASDPTRGIFILVLLGLTAGGAFLMYGLRAPQIRIGASFRPVSREGAILLNNVFLFTFCATVFMGTLYPIFLSALELGSISVGAPYFTATLTPLLIPFAILMGLGPMLAWRETLPGTLSRRVLVPGALTALLALAVALMPLPGRPFTVVMFLAAGWILFATLADFYRKTHRLTALRSLPPAYYGMVVAHAGFAVLLIGVTAATSWNAEKISWMTVGERLSFTGREVSFLGVRPDIGRNYTLERAIFRVTEGADDPGYYLQPEKRWYPTQERELSETALHLDGFDITYAVLGDQDKENPQRRVVRLYHHPLIALVLAGALMIAAGGLMSLAKPRREKSA